MEALAFEAKRELAFVRTLIFAVPICLIQPFKHCSVHAFSVESP